MIYMYVALICVGNNKILIYKWATLMIGNSKGTALEDIAAPHLYSEIRQLEK